MTSRADRPLLTLTVLIGDFSASTREPRAERLVEQGRMIFNNALSGKEGDLFVTEDEVIPGSEVV